MITDQQLTDFCAAIDRDVRGPYFADMDAKWVANHGFPYSAPTRFERGQKYARVIGTSGAQSSAYCFVRLDDGAILKAAGYKVPAKGVRGWIANGAADVTPHGAKYARNV